jgi:hypothetical protein
MYTTCDGVKAIENQKLWLVVAIVMKEILQSTSNVMGTESNQLVVPTKPQESTQSQGTLQLEGNICNMQELATHVTTQHLNL